MPVVRLIVFVVIVCSVVFPIHSKGATSANWNGGSGNWSDPTQWTTNPFYPTNGNGAPSYLATIGSGNVGLDIAVTLDALTINGGVLDGAGSLTADTIQLNNGTWSTTGTIQSNHVNLTGGVLDRDLTLSSGTSSIQNVNVAAGHTLTNGVNSILTAPAGPGERQAFGLGTFNNEGTFIKTGSARSYMSITHANNLGNVQVQQSALRFDQTGEHTGTFEISNGAQLEFAGTQSLSSTATISGDGTLAILGGTSTIDSNVTVGLFRLVGGTLSGTGNLTATSYSLEAGVLDRDLTLTSGTSSIQNVNVAAGHTLTNGVNAILITPAGPGERQAFGLGTFNNEGTFIKTGSARSYMSITHANNLGNVQVQQSALRFDQSGEHTGTFEISNGAQLEFAGTQSLSSTATISGDGTLAILGGTSTIDSNVTVGLFRLVGGTLSGTGNLTATSYSLEAGVLDRDLTLTSGTSSIQNVNVAAGHTLTNGVNAILITPAGPGERQAFGLGTFNNEGTFIKTGSARSYMSITHANNLGNVQVQQSALRFDQTGEHTGTFEISNGAQLEFAGTQSLASTATISGDGTLAILGGTSTIDSNVTVGLFRLVGGTLSGTGNLTATSYSLEAGVLDRDLTLSSGTSSIQNVNVAAGHTLTNGVNSILTAPAGPGERQAFGLGTFNNEGTFIKTGSARSYMSITHANNLGNVQVQQSALRFDQTGEHTGTFEVSAGAQIEFGGTQLLNSTATISGAGTMVIVGGNVTIDSDVTLSSVRVIGGVIKGNGVIHAPTSIENLLSGISAGDEVGTLTLNSGLTLQSGTILFWDLGALETNDPGVDWDQIVINGGQLNLGSFNSMKINLPGDEFSPISGNPFWGTSQRWEDIVTLTGGATGIVGVPNFTVDNTAWSRAGSFAVELSSDGRGLDVVWTAVPESSTFLLAGLVVIGFIVYLIGSGSFKMNT